MKIKDLYNQKNKKELIEILNKEDFKRKTISFYKYIKLSNLAILRDQLFIEWSALKILGRIYLSNEGINAQLNIPIHNWNIFINKINQYKEFQNIELKEAVQEGESFYKLTIKIKQEIVAYKIDKNEYDINNRGKHLDYKEYNQAIDNGAIIVDVRNRYESEIGKFKGAIIPDVDKSEDLLPEIKKILKNKKEEKILMYCTGGIRCEKASAYLIQNGFKDVNQLKGGIIQYAHDIKKNNAESKFIGKNFVFDHRMGENITEDIISVCDQCNKPSNHYINCENQACHILFIQCDLCNKKFKKCCSKECYEFNKFPKEKQKKLFKTGNLKFNAQKSKRLRPKLSEIK
ncbi:MAG: hypothetical protein CMG64_01275 [Candidatus Marinimicrobia bacterium]|nr:hypothetical protein [Candidatus Neomarinimicrobiota bacterium]|tara:strand:- start:1481 stop:2515 length:1035 start_codon:yes stop_codon:yes gene_type:complete